MALNRLPTRREILTNFATLLSGITFARMISAVALVLVARQVGPSSYGQYIACFSLAKLTSVAFSWGLDGWLLWRGGSAKNRHSVAMQSGISLAWKLVLGVLWFALLNLLAGQLNSEVFPRSILFITGLIVWSDDLINTVWSVFKSTLQNAISFKLIASVQVLLVLATAALVLADSRDVVAFLWARLGASAIGCIAALYLLHHHIGIGFVAAEMLPVFRAAAPFAASQVFSLIYERADVAIIGQFLGTEQTGIYGPASTIVTTLFLIPAAAYAVMVPVFTRIYALQPTAVTKTLRLFLTVNTALGICLAGALAFSANWIVNLLFGSQYAGSGPVLEILALVLGLRCVTFALGAAVVGTGQQTRRLKAQAFAAVLNVIINLLIVGVWGIRGVAWVYVFTELVLLIGYWLVLAPVRSGRISGTAP